MIAVIETVKKHTFTLWGLLSFVLAMLLYAYFGSFSKILETRRVETLKETQYYQSMLQHPVQLIKTMEEKLKHDEYAPRGWYLLGKLYAQQHDWKNAYRAFQTSLHIYDNDVTFASLAEAELMVNHQLSSQSEKRLKLMVKTNEKPVALLQMLALNSRYLGHTSETITYLREILGLIPLGSQDAKDIQSLIKHLLQSK